MKEDFGKFEYDNATKNKTHKNYDKVLTKRPREKLSKRSPAYKKYHFHARQISRFSTLETNVYTSQTKQGFRCLCSRKCRFPLWDQTAWDRNKIEPISVPIFCSSLNLWSATRMVKSWIFSTFLVRCMGRIIQYGKSPVRSEPALKTDSP